MLLLLCRRRVQHVEILQTAAAAVASDAAQERVEGLGFAPEYQVLRETGFFLIV